MKKFLLSLATISLAFGYSSAMAETVTFDFVNETYGLERLSGTTSDYIDDGTVITQEGVNITFKTSLEESTNESGCRLWSNGLRMYKGGTMVITCSEGSLLKTVSTTATLNGTFTSSAGDAAITFNANNPWFSTLGATEVTIAYVKDNSNGALPNLTIEYEKGTVSDKEPAGLSFNQNSFTIGNNEGFNKAVLSNPNELPITWTSSNEDVATVTTDGYIIIKGLGTTVISATSEETDKFAPGKASYTLNVVAAASNIAKMIEAAPAKGDKVLVTGGLTVVYSNGKYTYVTDIWEDATLLYDNSGKSLYQKGDQIPGGWEATNALYYGLLEWTGSFPQATASYPDLVEYETLSSVTAEDVNKVVWIKGIDFAEATPAASQNLTVTLPEGQEIVVRNQFGIESMEAGKYNMLCAVSIYNSTLQLYPIELATYTEPDDPNGPEFPASFDVAVDSEDVTVEQFDQDSSASGDYTIKITGSTKNADKTVTVTIAVPEGYSNLAITGDAEKPSDEVAPFRSANESSWIPVSQLLGAYGGFLGNTFVCPADNVTNNIEVFLVNDKNEADFANSISVTVKVKYDSNTGVDAVEVEEDAEYFTLQGVKVTNPVDGIYVKVVNGKAVKVIL